VFEAEKAVKQKNACLQRKKAAASAVAILNKMQAGKTALIEKDGEMLLAIVLDKPLAAQT